MICTSGLRKLLLVPVAAVFATLSGLLYVISWLGSFHVEM